MSKNAYALCLLFLAAFPAAIAQNAIIRGKVTDASTGEPLIATTVSAGDNGTLTEYNGDYELSLEPGTYTVTFRYIGYKAHTETASLAAGQQLVLNASLQAQATVLETATVTSGKYEKPLGEVTVSLEVLRPELVRNAGKGSIDGALEKIPGVTIIDGQANIRGGSGYSQGAGSRVLLLVDDMPILSADAGFPNWADVPVENIAQVEVVKGAASALYGSSALNGIINIRTAYPTTQPQTTGAIYHTLYLAPEDERLKWWDEAPFTFGAQLSHRRKIGKLDLVLGGNYINEESYNKDIYRRIGRFNFSTRYRITDRLTIGLNGNLNAGNTSGFLYWASDTMAYVGAPNTYSARDRLRYNIDPLVTYFDKSGNRHRFLGRFYSVSNNNDAGQSNASDLYYAEYQVQRQLKEEELILTAGLVGSGTFIEAELYGDTTFTSRNLAGYIQADKKFFGRLTLSAGFRYENNRLNNPGFIDFEQDTIAPSNEREAKPVFRLGLNYKLTAATFLRASWGQGYRFPTVAEKFIQTNAGFLKILPNPALTSETGWSTEVGIKQGFRINGFEGFVDLAAFLSRYQEMIEFNFSSQGFRAENIGGTEIKGFEVTLAGRGELFGLPLSILSGYTYIDPRFDDFDPDGEEGSLALSNAINSSSEENILKYRSQHLVKLDIESKFFKGAFLGVELFHNSRVEAIDNILQILPGVLRFREEHDQGFTVLNFRAGYEFSNNWRLAVLLNNSLNQEFAVRPGLLEAPRNLTMRVDFSF